MDARSRSSSAARPATARLAGDVRRGYGECPTRLRAARRPSCGRRHGARLALGAQRRLGRRGLLEFAGSALVSAATSSTSTFASEQARGLLAPWVLHTGLGPDQAVSGSWRR